MSSDEGSEEYSDGDFNSDNDDDQNTDGRKPASSNVNSFLQGNVGSDPDAIDHNAAENPVAHSTLAVTDKKVEIESCPLSPTHLPMDIRRNRIGSTTNASGPSCDNLRIPPKVANEIVQPPRKPTSNCEVAARYGSKTSQNSTSVDILPDALERDKIARAHHLISEIQAAVRAHQEGAVSNRFPVLIACRCANARMPEWLLRSHERLIRW